MPETDAEMITRFLPCSREDALRYLQVLRCPRAVHDALDSGASIGRTGSRGGILAAGHAD